MALGKMTLGNSDLEKCPVTQINGWPKRPSHIVRVDTNAPVGASGGSRSLSRSLS